MESSAQLQSKTRPWVIVTIIVVLLVVLTTQLPILEFLPQIWGKVSIFATVFLGIFIEAIPFLLLGTIGSGFVEAFLDHDQVQRLIPRRALPGALAGSLLGMIFPVCECGVVPLTRRLFSKGLPVAAGIAFLLAAPVLNPIVILSTSAAFGWGWMLVGRVGLSMSMAVIVGLLFSVLKSSSDILLSPKWAHKNVIEILVLGKPIQPRSFREKLNQMAVIAGDEFFEMGRFLIIGATLAAGMQALIPQQVLLQIGRGPVTSVLVMLALAVILSICSTVDAFVVLGFASIFSPGAILAFLIFGPMVDIKTTLMYLSVFKKRAVLYLILLPFAMSFLAGLVINVFLA
jgi:uncharacterized membrane protein YraQ (UPF0718 family)